MSLTYYLSTLVGTVGLEITPNGPQQSIPGNQTIYSIAPSLPQGLQINSTTGIISGIPQIASVSNSYIVAATAGSTSAQTTLILAINLPGPLCFGCSAELTGRYLSIEMEFGTEQIKYPERVNKIQCLVKNSKGMNLRSWSVDPSLFENQDGIYRTGTILSSVESPDRVFCSAETQDGLFQAEANLFISQNKVTQNTF